VTNKARWSAVIAGAVSLVLAGCGGGAGRGSHTYVFSLGSGGFFPGAYLTIVSPAAIPTDFFTKNGTKLLSKPRGPQACSYEKTLHGGHGSSAFLNGKTLMVKINGSTHATSDVCAVLRKTPSLPVWAISGP
jgi:hypothetical protein